MNRHTLRTGMGALFIALVTAFAALAIFTASRSEAAPRNPVTPATVYAARFCDTFPDITYSLQTQCIRVALTPARQGESNGFPDGRVMVRECIAEANAQDDGRYLTRPERYRSIRNCLHWAGFSG